MTILSSSLVSSFLMVDVYITLSAMIIQKTILSLSLQLHLVFWLLSCTVKILKLCLFDILCVLFMQQ